MKEVINIDGKEYRVAANWNAIRDYCGRKGVTDLSKLDSIVQFDVSDILTLAHCCIKEGERMEGKELVLSEEELGEIMSPVSMTVFINIYVGQSTTGIGQNDAGESKKK